MTAKIVKRKVFINRKTGQASVTLPKKVVEKYWGEIPPEILLELKRRGKFNVKWQ